VRAVIVASAATIAPVAHGIVLQAQGASQAAPTVDPAVVARIRALKAEASRLQQQRQTAPGEEFMEMQRRIEQITADVSGMPETEWTTWVMPFPSVLGRVAKDPSQPRSTATYISEAVRRAEARVRAIGFGDIEFTVSNNLSEVVVRGERWMVALAAEAMREEVEHVWNRFQAMESERIDLLVEFLPGAQVSALDFVELSDALERVFGRRVDLIELSAVTNPILREAFISDRMPFYAAA
jgi:hypothetical protein